MDRKQTDKKLEDRFESTDPLELFEKATLDFFDTLLASDHVDKTKLADKAGGIGKYLLKHAVAISAGIEFEKLKDKDFVMVTHAITVALREMVNGFEDEISHLKGKTH